MAKDPTFPFYAQDYIVDTLRWSRGMKSLHVDLLAESWINGALIDDGGHPAGLFGDDLVLWEQIKHKWERVYKPNPFDSEKPNETQPFLKIKPNEKAVVLPAFWINEKLEETRVRRESFREKQKEVGKKGGRPKKAVVAGVVDLGAEIKNPKETQPFLEIKPNGNPKETLLENEYEKEKEIELLEGVVGETIPPRKFLIPEMLSVWLAYSPGYPCDREKDYEALGNIAKFLSGTGGGLYDPEDPVITSGILTSWKELSVFVSGHDFFRNYSLQQVSTHSQNIYQSLKNEGKRKNKQSLQPGGITIPAGPRNYGKL